jgi:hypothetical protein
MKRIALALAAAWIAGCGPTASDPADDFRAASPSRQGIDIKTPSNGQALTSADVESTQQALGQVAPWYVATRLATVAVNGTTAVILGICETIVSYPPTTLTDHEAVWGPWTEPLSPDTYKFTVDRNADGTYEYKLEGKPKTAGDSAYVKVLFGHHEPSGFPHIGKGHFTLDWDAMQALGSNHTDVGNAVFSYERNTHFDVTIGVKFNQVWDDGSHKARIDAAYAFSQVAGGDGSFEFAKLSDWAGIPNSVPGNLERFSIKSRWTVSGAGRADIRASGGDLPFVVTASECWGNTFLEVYYTDSLNLSIAPTAGKESDCAFAPASYTDIK